MRKFPPDYNVEVETIRPREYPNLKDTVYLDHAGTTPYAKSAIERFSADMVTHLYGNPHSASSASQLTCRRIEDIRLRLLRFFNADPEEFDLVFVANATAGVKLVAETFRELEGGFRYLYHRDCHTSLVGVRELATEHECVISDEHVEDWISTLHWEAENSTRRQLFAYPAQSNMNGRRLPLDWCERVRCSSQKTKQEAFTLLDAAAFVSTAPLDLSDAGSAPDFTVLSLYKIFGFPDLGALIVRKASGHILRRRKYFGGGTVDMVVCLREHWHAKKSETIHDQLEDGTLPIHSIIALDSAIDVYHGLFGSLDRVSRHTTFLGKKLHDGLTALRHGNGLTVCKIYKDTASTYGDARSQGPIIAFNIRNLKGAWMGNFEVEKLAAVKNIHLRTGGLCNPGGMASSLDLAAWEMKQNFSAGHRCGSENDVLGGKPTGMIRVSLGAMSTLQDIEAFIEFVQEFFVEASATIPGDVDALLAPTTRPGFHVESLTVYPIKSCAGWRVGHGTPWRVNKEGLAWDREWCLIHRGTGNVMSQKRYPAMALIKPILDLEEGLLQIRYVGLDAPASISKHGVTVPLSVDPTYFSDSDPESFRKQPARVCGDTINAQIYKSPELAAFFTQALGVACTLARYPAAGSSRLSARHSKGHVQPLRQRNHKPMPGAFPEPWQIDPPAGTPILLSNESPILVISRSSLDRLNEDIQLAGGKAARAEVFRANIVVAEDLSCQSGSGQPYAEDRWQFAHIGGQLFRMLGSCRRCHMVCIDQSTAVRNEEPFVTLSKTRRFDGKVFFGQHSCHVPVIGQDSPASQNPTIMVGDSVVPYGDGERPNEPVGLSAAPDGA